MAAVASHHLMIPRTLLDPRIAINSVGQYKSQKVHQLLEPFVLGLPTSI
jgi:hypothetical protein